MAAEQTPDHEIGFAIRFTGFVDIATASRPTGVNRPQIGGIENPS